MIKIPKGKEVKILLKGKNIMEGGAKIVLASPITISLSSSFSSLLPDMSGGAMNFLNQITGIIQEKTGVGIGAQFKEQGFQVWKGTEPIKFSFECLFSFKTSGLKDVLTPAKALMKLPLPEEKDWGLTPPGPTILSTFTKVDEKTIPYSNTYSFRCGSLCLPKILISSVEPTFSEEVDSDGYFMSCSLRVDVESLYTATTNQIDKFGSGSMFVGDIF